MNPINNKRGLLCVYCHHKYSVLKRKAREDRERQVSTRPGTDIKMSDCCLWEGGCRRRSHCHDKVVLEAEDRNELKDARRQTQQQNIGIHAHMMHTHIDG